MSMSLRLIGALAALAAPAAASAQALPSYYPTNYGQIVEASKKEQPLYVYGNVGDVNWKPIIAGFHQKYPWVKVAAGDVGPAVAFERYYAESAAKRPTADVIVVSAPDEWMRFIDRGQLVDYQSPEAGHLPKWSMPSKGLYVFSADPMIIIYNKLLLPPQEQPKSIAQFEKLAQANPKKFKLKFTTYDASSHPMAYDMQWSMVNKGHVGGWDYLTKLAPFTRPSEAGVDMLDKVTSGEYFAAYYTSPTTVWPFMKERGNVIGWTYPADGVPMVLRPMAITKASHSPNSARLFLDYMLSRDGEIAEAHGGMTPYRPDVTEQQAGAPTYDSVVRAVGASNIVLITTDRPLLSDYDGFIKRWRSLFPRH